jgi:hypothetical protein
MRLSISVISFAISIAFTITTACGQKKWDDGGGDHLWTTAANWKPDGVPATSDTVVLDNTYLAGSYTIYDTASAQTVYSCQIGYAGNMNTITVIVGGSTANALTVNGGGSTALYITDGGALKNLSRSGTRGIKLGSASDVFKMSGSGRYIHGTSSGSSKIPQPTSGATASNYDFSPTSVFELQTAIFDSIPVYGTLEYNDSTTKSAGRNLTISGDLLVDQGTLGICASTSNTFTIGGNVAIANGATFRGSSSTGTSTITVAGSVTGAGTFQGSSSGSGTTIITVGGDLTSLISFGSGTTNVTFSGGAPSVNFSPANGTTPIVKNITVAAGKTVAFSPAGSVNLSIASGETLTVRGVFVLGTHAVSGSGNIIVTGALGIGDSSGLNGNVKLTGTKTYNGATFIYNGTSPQVTGTAVPAGITNLTIDNISGVTLSQNVLISGILTLTAGHVITGTNILSIGSSGGIAGGSSSSYVVTDSSGSLVLDSVGAAPVLFPVGTPSSYAPVTMNNSGSPDTFSMAVRKSFTHPPNTSACVNLQWTINEATPGGSNVALSFQWSAIDESTSTFKRSKPVYIGRWNGAQWVQTPATLAGSNPYTASSTGFTQFSDFGVGNDGALPIQLASFSGTTMNGNHVKLDWTTMSETNCLGFYVERRADSSQPYATISGLIPGARTSASPHDYSWVDSTAASGTYYYRLRQVDLDSDVSYSSEVMIALGPLAMQEKPDARAFSLLQNYPNPFNPTTDFGFRIADLGFVSLKVYDEIGKEVATLVNEVKQPGEYTVQWKAQGMASGIYFYRLDAMSTSDPTKSFTQVKKMLMLK